MAFKSIGEILETFGESIVDSLGKNLPAKKDSTGELRQSIKFSVRYLGDSYSFKLSLADYYKFVDKGRKPGGKFPWNKSKGLGDEGNVLFQWLKAKRLVLHKGKLVVKSKSKLSLEDRKRRSLAFLMGRKIKKKGIPPTNFYSGVVNEDLINNLKKDLKAALKKEVLIEIKNL